MKNITALAAATSLMALLAGHGAMAQSALVGNEALDDRIDDITDNVNDEFAKSNDAQRFNGSVQQGFSGSLSASLSLTSGNTDTSDFSVGSRLRYGSGPWNHSFGVALEYGEENDEKNKEEAFATYEANRYFNDRFYMFGLGSVSYVGYGEDLTDSAGDPVAFEDSTATRFDAFLGFGPGYRIINSDSSTWRVQLGVGARYIESQNGDNVTETAGLAASRVYHKFNETVFLTNDTDVLFSDASTTVTNEFGVNFKVSDKLSTRLGYRTEYESDPADNQDNTDNKLTAAIVYGF